jgi:uncharacterized protein YraI
VPLRGAVPTAAFKVGDAVVTTDVLNVREGKGRNHRIVMTLPVGTRATIKDGPRGASGYTWWDLTVAGKGSGRAAENWLVKAAAPVPT